MKKIGIITLWQIGNYGAELQAYALARAINDLGYDCENIDYPFYKNKDFKLTRRGRTPFSIGWSNILKEFLLPKMKAVKAWSHPGKKKARAINFRKLYQLTPHSSKRFLSFDELYSYKDFDYDTCIAGSDQIWNPRSLATIEPYFLTFAPPGTRKISYASSLGVSDIPDSLKPIYKNYLQDFKAISVRESGAVGLIEAISGQPVVQVLDPTLLLDAGTWKELSGSVPAISKPYLLLYDLIPNKTIISLARKIAEDHGLPVYRICRDASANVIPGITNLSEAGPLEFLSAIEHSSYVVTNSFHGTVFSILFHKQFLSLIPSKMNNSSRISSLLNMFSLGDRMIAETEGAAEFPSKEIDYDRVDKLLEKEKEFSVNYIKSAIQGD